MEERAPFLVIPYDIMTEQSDLPTAETSYVKPISKGRVTNQLEYGGPSFCLPKRFYAAVFGEGSSQYVCYRQERGHRGMKARIRMLAMCRKEGFNQERLHGGMYSYWKRKYEEVTDVLSQALFFFIRVLVMCLGLSNPAKVDVKRLSRQLAEHIREWGNEVAQETMLQANFDGHPLQSRRVSEEGTCAERRPWGWPHRSGETRAWSFMLIYARMSATASASTTMPKRARRARRLNKRGGRRDCCGLWPRESTLD